jgi:hypothetical protein
VWPWLVLMTLATVPAERVIVIDPSLASVMAHGYARSATFRDLVQRVDASGWVVFVQNGSCPMKQAEGCLLHTVGRFEGRPYLRVRIVVTSRHPERVLMTIAHELQHALEAINSGTVHDGPTLVALFERIGDTSTQVTGGVMSETNAARAAEERVRRDLRRRVR